MNARPSANASSKPLQSQHDKSNLCAALAYAAVWLLAGLAAAAYITHLSGLFR